MQPSTVFTLLALTTTIASALPAASNEPRGNRPTHTGRATVFAQKGGRGSCGQKHSDDSHIVAISNSWMKNESPSHWCGRKIKITNTGSNDGVGGAGNVLEVTIADTCPSCSEDQVDLSIGAWNSLTDNAPFGTFTGAWHFCETDGSC